MVSFVSGWVAGELAFQNMVWQAGATALFVWLGALDGWAGWLGLAVAAGTWAGLFGLGFAGLRASGVTSAALAEVRTGDLPVPAGPTPPSWGRWWRVSRAFPLRSRAIEVGPRPRLLGRWRPGPPTRCLPVATGPGRRRVRPQGTGHGLRPRRGMGHRRQARAGQTHDVRAGHPRLDLCGGQLPLEPDGHVGRTISSTSSGLWRGSRTTSRGTEVTPPSWRSAAGRPAVTSVRCWR